MCVCVCVQILSYQQYFMLQISVKGWYTKCIQVLDRLELCKNYVCDVQVEPAKVSRQLPCFSFEGGVSVQCWFPNIQKSNFRVAKGDYEQILYGSIIRSSAVVSALFANVQTGCSRL